jgi:hypothetical protein
MDDSKTQYPHLAALLDGYFHQDFDVNGSTLEEIIDKSRADSSPAEIDGTIQDIHRFIQAFGDTDAHLAAAFERIFQPGVIVEGWEGMSTRQWLQRIANLYAEKTQ